MDSSILKNTFFRGILLAFTLHWDTTFLFSLFLREYFHIFFLKYIFIFVFFYLKILSVAILPVKTNTVLITWSGDPYSICSGGVCIGPPSMFFPLFYLEGVWSTRCVCSKDLDAVPTWWGPVNPEWLLPYLVHKFCHLSADPLPTVLSKATEQPWFIPPPRWGDDG